MDPTAVTATATPPPPGTIAQTGVSPGSYATPKNEIYELICSQIIKVQGQIIGDLTFRQASQVPGLQINHHDYSCTINGDGKQVTVALVEKYREFFGNAAVEVCRDAAAHFSSRLNQDELPAIFRTLDI